MVENLTDKLEDKEISRVQFEKRYKDYLARLEMNVNIASNNYNTAKRAFNTYHDDLANFIIHYTENDKNEILYTKSEKKRMGFVDYDAKEK